MDSGRDGCCCCEGTEGAIEGREISLDISRLYHSQSDSDSESLKESIDELLEGRRKEEFWLGFWIEKGCMAARLGLKRGDGSKNSSSSSEVEGVNGMQVDWAPGLDDRSETEGAGEADGGGQGNLERSLKANLRESGELCGL